MNEMAIHHDRNGSLPLVCTEMPLITTTRQLGVTLVELMAVLAVAVILMGIAVPAIGDFIRNSRMVTQTNEFVADLALARSEAIKRAANVVVCKSSNPTTSPPSCNTTGDNWSSGWIVFVDNETVNNALDADEEVLRTRVALEGNNTLFAAAGVANLITYGRAGLSSLTAAASFALCDQRGAVRGRSITIEVTGRPNIRRNPDSCDPT
jgi:type IV fimbrial biogenesis protein FimT